MAELPTYRSSRPPLPITHSVRVVSSAGLRRLHQLIVVNMLLNVSVLLLEIWRLQR